MTDQRALLVLIVLACTPVMAADIYPSRPIRLIVPFAPGGGTDITARAASQRLTEAWKQPVIVDNRPGGGTVIGTALAAKSPRDGYTLLLTTPSLTINPSLRRDLPYDALRDFEPVSQTATQAYVLVVNPALPVRSVKEFIALAKAKPGALNYGSSGIGSGAQLAAELFKVMTGTDMVHISYKGNSLAITDVMGGQIQFLFATILPVLQHVKGGRLQALGVSTAHRATALPDLPTIAESGVPGYEASSWNGVVVPRGTPADIVKKLNAELVAIMHAPAMRAVLANDGADAIGSTAAEFEAVIRRDMAKWGKVIRAAGLHAE